jgi:hypothetical protein
MDTIIVRIRDKPHILKCHSWIQYEKAKRRVVQGSRAEKLFERLVEKLREPHNQRRETSLNRLEEGMKWVRVSYS